ncbi:outer membrane receptor protein [Belliella baltica DSM 15883]|uniref:Outer membrane receptor protein n=1 Tax=Belliella baltica (strain DSM 15883 / CIP 108006 / LMG 21964 / BA134) TaxID=866536 RepID=I3Z7D1_BELBD|nr:TonB-dependent receptor [Belliella baltica]AFL85149.1 outer membrane receptor protein [Belliella baltica DSM 15883]
MQFLFRFVVFVICFGLVSHGTVFSQNESLVEGVVFDFSQNLPIPGANVYWEDDLSSGVTTDLDGKFQIKLTNLPSKLIISFVGFEQVARVIQAKDLTKPIQFFLREEDIDLQEVTVSSTRPDENVRSLDLGKSVVPIQTIKNIPALFGEVDLLRSLQLLPGVQTAGEGTTGLFVRGGSADQNLLQIDGAPVYNPSHFFGFFSVFNPDALSGVDFYKGNIPANFGGRVSSVIDISLKEGNFEKVKGEGGIGTISSRLTVDGPLLSDKSSFSISGRRTYADMFLRLSSDPNINSNDLYFYDLNGKFTFLLGDRDKLTVSSYYGSDYLGLSAQFGLGWSNWVSSIIWNRNISKNFFFDLTAYHSSYQYNVDFDDPDSGFKWGNTLAESGLKATWTYQATEKTELKWGAHSQLYSFSPISLIPTPGSAIEPFATNPRNGLQNNLYIGGTTEINPKLSVEAGIRWSIYQQQGKGVDYRYEGGQPSPEAEIIDSLVFGRFERIKDFQGIEPRLAARYLLNEGLSLKASFNRSFQYLQVASNSSAGLPIDRWILAGTYVPPIRGDQVSVGIFKNLNDNIWEISAEGYYKDFKNIIDLRQGANILFTDNVETEILTGNGYAYGLEFLLRKNVGKSTGWLSYTYSRTWRQVPGISFDQWYNPRFDRPHDLTLVVNHEFNKRWSAGLTIVYTTGQAVTFPVGSYEVDSQRLPLFSGVRNDDRFPDYHRMDASVTWKNADKGRKWRGSWNFSVYNLYGRKNPFAYQFTEIFNDQINFTPGPNEMVTSRRPGVIMTYLFTFLPSLTYNFNF